MLKMATKCSNFFRCLTDSGDTNMAAVTWSATGSRTVPVLASGLGDT
jgi:hypothetical protein